MKDLDELLDESGLTFEAKHVINIMDNNKTAIASLYVDDKYIMFHDQFTQIGITFPIFHQLIEEGWKSNHK